MILGDNLGNFSELLGNIDDKTFEFAFFLVEFLDRIRNRVDDFVQRIGPLVLVHTFVHPGLNLLCRAARALYYGEALEQGRHHLVDRRMLAGGTELLIDRFSQVFQLLFANFLDAFELHANLRVVRLVQVQQVEQAEQDFYGSGIVTQVVEILVD